MVLSSPATSNATTTREFGISSNSSGVAAVPITTLVIPISYVGDNVDAKSNQREEKQQRKRKRNKKSCQNCQSAVMHVYMKTKNVPTMIEHHQQYEYHLPDEFELLQGALVCNNKRGRGGGGMIIWLDLDICTCMYV
jgi:hypothetical protein